MPRRDDISSVLVIGSGPIVIGQACEFDYSGTQACRVLRAEGLRVSLVNSNPATIMTDPDTADATYIEPITVEMVEKVIARERPDAMLATLGGQTALNTAVALHDAGVLERYGVRLLGADIEAIRAGEDRQRFKEIVGALPGELGAESARSATARTMEEALAAAGDLGYPLVVRPSYTLGGKGGGIAADEDDLRRIAGGGLAASANSQVLLEESILGWKEFELELMRDRADNVVVVCSIENVDPMGVHTGDSVTVAPAMTLTDREYQRMRDVAIAIMRAVGVDAGGCNIQFATDPRSGRLVVIEMNPRVSRSSALASKATGFPIAKISAKLALGYTLDEIANDITTHGGTPPVDPPDELAETHGGTPPVDPPDELAGTRSPRLVRIGQTAAFEPALDYVVVKIPRFTFEKFPGADARLTTHMKSVGEVMAIGRSFGEALQKAMRSLETGEAGFWTVPDTALPHAGEPALDALRTPHDGRLYTVMRALEDGASVDEVCEASGMDPWFVDQVDALREHRDALVAEGLEAAATSGTLRRAKRSGFSDRQVAAVLGRTEIEVRQARDAAGLHPVYKTVDTCAAEFAAFTPYHYSSYDEETEVEPRDRPAVLVLGSGPNRIGQGIEFDYACCHAAFALSAAGYETVMVNCNPETVSTDYDTSDRLYFEPLTVEDVVEVVRAEQQAGPVAGVIVQLGGQTPLRIAAELEAAGVPIVGTSPAAIDLAEDRGAFGRVLAEAGLLAPRHGTATSYEGARLIAAEIGYPVLVRPSYVLGGRGMEIVYDAESLEAYVSRATDASPEHPILVDRFLDDAVEVDVDALYDGTELYLAGVMEHIEEAGIHSGDSACALPPITLGADDLGRIREATLAVARGVGVLGLLNVQYAVQSDVLYVLEANPRASRTVPFVAKATGVPLAAAASRVMLGATIAELRTEGLLPPAGDATDLPLDSSTSVKEAVLPFNRFADEQGRGVDTVLGPEMKSTGEVMGIDASFGVAYAKSQAAAYGPLPTKGRVFVSVANRDKRAMVFPVKRLADLGFEVLATAGTAQVLRRNGVDATVVPKHSSGEPGDAVSRILAGEVDLVINTPFGVGPRVDGYEIRTACVTREVPCVTTIQAAAAAVQGVEALVRGEIGVRSLQEWHADLLAARASLDGAPSHGVA